MTETTAKRKKVYPRSVKGRFRSIRWAVSALLLGIYFGLPWLTMDGRQAVLFDIPGRKFFVFNLVFWPQEVYYLAILLVILVLALFFFTALAGRLWCGYACPQTVFTDVFMAIERLVEGDRGERIRLDSSALTPRKAAEKAAKHFFWLVFSFATAFAFVSYFVPPAELASRIVTGELTGANVFWLGLFTATTYGDCGFFRELMCLVPCPYGRFQSALFDPDTLIIGYDPKRGEPRGKAGRSKGDCIDCTMCVQVCPTGIDIREGLQCECIACAQCIDACDRVMDRVGKPRGLIRYGSLKSLAGGTTRVLRPRVAVYGVLMALMVGGVAYGLSSRVPVGLEVLRDRSALYNETSDGRLTNLYTIKAINRDTRGHSYRVRIEGLPAEVVMGANPITVKSGSVYQTTVLLVLKDRAAREGINRLEFVMEAVDEPGTVVRRKSTFFVPSAGVGKAGKAHTEPRRVRG